MIKKMGFICLFLASTLFAQNVTSIKFDGLVHLSPKVAKEVGGIHIGDPLSADTINDSIKRFFAQGYFDDIWVDKNSGNLVYHFKEKKSIANLQIKGYGTGDDGKKLIKGIGLKKGDLYDEMKIKRAKRAILAKLEAKGLYDSVVELSVKPVGEKSLSIVFDVNKGEKITIKKMNFVGAKKLIKSDIELDLSNKEQDWLGWLPWRNSGEANVKQLEYDAFRIRDAYMREGYLDATVSKPLMRVDFGSYNAEVDYKVHEGIQYRVGKITISQNIQGLSVSQIKDMLSLKEGKIFNIKKMRKDIKLLQEKVGNYGYAFANINPQMQKNTEAKTVDLNYLISSGEVVTIGDVVISGNDNTKDRVIRRYIYLASGDKFNATDLKDSKNALGRTGFFEGVDIQTQRVSSNVINLLVKVKETSTGALTFGGGYGSYEGVMLNASVSDKNIFGSGINASLGFQISKISRNYNLSFSNPKVWDSMYSLSMSVYKRDYEYIEYQDKKVGASISVGREFHRFFNASIGVGYVDNQSSYNSSYTTALVNYYNDKYQKASFYLSFNFDNTDNYYIPREGVKARLNFEYGQLSGSDFNSTVYSGYTNILKTDFKIGTYYGLEELIDYDLILRAKYSYTNIKTTDGKYLPIAERLYMGGSGSVRGFNPYTISPTISGERIGGTYSSVINLEASIPLSTSAKMRLAFFYDYGTIGSSSIPNQPAFEDITRSSTGVVLEWQSSFGPINLIFAKALNPQATDQTSVFEFAMGSKF